MDNLVQQKDLKVLVTDIVQKLLTNFEEKENKIMHAKSGTMIDRCTKVLNTTDGR
jgi:hypothetical protein